MEYSKDLVWLYCSNPSGGQCKDEITSIVETRGSSLYQRSKFQDLLKQMQSILDKCIDCRILSQLLLLLQELLPKAKPEIASLWNTDPDRNINFQHFFVHGQEKLSCTMCSLVQSNAAYLDKELNSNIKRPTSVSTFNNIKEEKESLALSCMLCKSNDATKIVLSCGHALCRNCGNNAVKKIKTSSEKSFICPVDRNLCGLKSLESKLGLGEASPSQQSPMSPSIQRSNSQVTAMSPSIQRSNSSSSMGSGSGRLAVLDTMLNSQMQNEVNCPLCKQKIRQTPGVGLLAECFPCNFSFCAKCFKEFHGNNECSRLTSPPPRAGFGNMMERSISVNSNYSGDHEESKDFNTNSKPDLFEAEEIEAAFQFLNTSDDEVAPAPEWPWETVSSAEGRTPAPSLQYPHPYESLRVGYWVEDELLEKAIEIIIQQELEEVSDRVCILESYVINWSLRKHTGEEELFMVLQEKQLFKKQLIFALINTDPKGHGGHWILAVIIVKTQKIIIMDSSLVLSTTYYQKYFFGLLHILHIANQFEGVGKGFDASKWKLFVSLDAVQQNNAYDCGPMVVGNAYALCTRGAQLDRTPKSFMVREWIHHTLVNFGKKSSNSLGKGSKVTNNVTGFKNIPKKAYVPSGLAIRFKFFKNAKLI